MGAAHPQLIVPSNVLIRPQPGPQTAISKCPVTEMFIGGARGGGKSIAILLKWVLHAFKVGKDARGMIFRRTYKELEQIIDDAMGLLIPLGAKYSISHKTFVMPNKARLRFTYILRDVDARNYQGFSNTFVAFDEVTNFPSMAPIDMMRATLRSAKVDPKHFVFLLSGNPGGPSHNIIKSRYIDPSPPFRIFKDEKGNKKVFIPSLLKHNPALQKNDPGYAERLREAGPDWLVDAWLHGRWDIVAGGMFDDVWDRNRHVIPPFTIPKSWYMDRSFDWGSAKPFSVGWWAESDGTPVKLRDGRIVSFPRGTVFRIAEWYGWNGKENQGLRMLSVEIARGIIEREKMMRINGHCQPGPADSSIYNIEDGKSIADDMGLVGVRWTKANKSPGSRRNGWELMRGMFKASLKFPNMEEPGIFIFDTCRQFIRTVPTLARSDRDPDDVNTDSEDHIADETRYKILHEKRDVTVSRLIGA